MKITRTSTLLAAYLLLLLPARAQWTNWSSSAGGNDHWYRPYRVGAPISWLTASNLASARGSYLATITSEEENTFVFNLINKPMFWNGALGLGPVFGGFQPPDSPEPAGGWTWITGEPWNYTHWAGGQPDNAVGVDGVREDCVHFWQGPFWNDLRKDSDVFVAYVVERDTPPMTIDISVTQVGITWVALSNQHYQVFYQSALTKNVWEPLSTNVVVGTGNPVTVYDSVPPGSPQRFYQVEKLDSK